MRWTEHSLDGIAHSEFGHISPVRTFTNCTVFSAARQGRLVLVIHNPVQRKLVLCEYESEQERAADIRHLLSL